MTKRKIFKRIAFAVVILIVTVVAAAFFVLRSRAFHRFVLAEIVSHAEQATGAKVQLGDVEFQLRDLRVDLYRIVIHGTEPTPAQPLLRVDHLEAEVKIISLLGRNFGLRRIQVDHPVVHLIVGAHGKTNLPHPPPSPSTQTSGSTNLFSLAIDRFNLYRGQVDVNDHQIPLQASLRNLKLESVFDARKSEYDGALQYSAGEIQVAAYRPLVHSLTLSFSADPEEIRANPLVIRAARSSLSIRAILRDYSHPVVKGSYSVRLSVPEAARVVRSTVVPAGEILMSGVLDYASAPGKALLDSITLSGALGSRHLSARLQQARYQVSGVSGKYYLERGNLVVDALRADLFGGRLAANGSIRNLAGLARGKLVVSLQSLSIGAMKAALPHNHWAHFPLAGSLSATAEASWRGPLNQVRVSTDASLSGAVNVAGAQKQPRTIPLHATVRAAYDAQADALTLRQSVLQTPQSEIEVNGSLGKHAALTISARSRDLREIDQFVTEAREFAATPSTKVSPLGVSGSASFQGVVQGTVHRPRVSGNVVASNLRILQTVFPQVQAHVAVSDSEFALSGGELRAAQGSARFRASAGLQNWAYRSTEPLSCELTANRMSLAALESLGHLKYPVKGILSAHISVRGTASHPEGGGTIQIVRAEAWSQPIEQIGLRFHGNGIAVQSTAAVETPGGKILANLTYSPQNEGYQGKVTMEGLNLGRLHLLKAYQVSGIATASISGQGTLRAPQLAAKLSIPDLHLGRQTITGVSAQIGVANQVATLTFASSFYGIPARASGTINLTGDYQAAMNFSTGTIEAGRLLSSYLPGRPPNIQCTTQVKASLNGPLKNEKRFQAHIEIPTFRLGYQAVHISSVSAITADYQNGSLVLNPGEIKGTSTDFRFQGSVPLASNGPINASATGNVDLHIAQIFEPSLASSGELEIKVSAKGTRSHPQVQGQAQIVNATFVPPNAPLGIQNMNGVIAFNSNRAQIKQLTAQAGGGSLAASGSVSYEHGMQFNLVLKADSVHLAYPEGVNEVFAAQLTLLGTQNAALLSGQVLINDLSLAPQFDLTTFTNQFNTVSTPAGPSPGFTSNTKLNVAVRSSHELTVTSDQLSLTGAADVRIVGTIDDPVVVGRVTLANGGTLIFGGNRYRVQTGTIDFVNPVMTEPVLDVSLVTTVNQYEVTLTFTGPADRLRTTYTSNPSLAAADIISLLMSGHPTEAPSTGLGAESVLAQGLGQASSRALKMAGLSSLIIDPQVGGYQSNPGVNIGMQKQVTKNLFFTFTVNTATSQDAVIQVQYQLSRRWSVQALRDEVGGYSLEIRSHRSF